VEILFQACHLDPLLLRILRGKVVSMKTVVIYQAPFEQTALGFDREADYCAVWSETCEDKISLEKIWKRFQRIDENNMPPDGYVGRSLSIGDVVAIGAYEFFTPEPVGWRKLTLGERAAVCLSALGDLGTWAEKEGLV
jgi:hypothetical protein